MQNLVTIDGDVRPPGRPATPGPRRRFEALEQRLAQLEAYDQHVNGAIDQLVDAMLELRNLQTDSAPTAAPGVAEELQSLKAKVKDLEQQLQVERSGRDLTKVSRMHAKTRSVVFVGTTYFGDNVKYAWLGVRHELARRGIEARFLPYHAEQQLQVESLGGSCLPAGHAQWTTEHVGQALAAAVVVTSDHFLNPNPFALPLMAGARHVQLWHGVSIKEIGLRNLPSGRALAPHAARVLATCGPYATLVGTAVDGEAEWRRWFSFERYAAIGYPRNDVLYREPTEADLVNVDRAAYDRAGEARAAGRRVVLYAPTFRDGDRGRWLLDAGLERVAAAVAAQGDCLIVNLHPVEQPQIPQLSQALPGVSFVAPRTDVYPLLRRTHALVTDYSSVMFDYLHLQQPVILFRPDHEAYTQRSRRLFDDKLATMPGPVVGRADELATLLRQPQFGQTNAHRKAREQLLAQWYDHHDGRAAERLVDVIEAELARAGVPAA